MRSFGGRTLMERPLRKKIPSNVRMTPSNKAKRVDHIKIVHEGLCEDVNELSGCAQ